VTGACTASVIAGFTSPAHAAAAASQAWPAFVLVAGLLLIGAVAAGDGLFAAAGGQLARLPGGGKRLLAVLLVFEACVTAVLNLDTAVVFLTPVLLHAARGRGLDEEPFLYGAVFMANSASLLLPGSNLTNLIVLAHEHVPGHLFAARMFPAWLVSIAATIALLLIVYGRRLARAIAPAPERTPFRLRYGIVGVVVAAVLVLVLPRPAIPVLVTAAALGILARLRPRTALKAVNPFLLIGLFATAVALGTLARGIESLDDLTSTLGRWSTAGVGAGASLLVNNLPAAVVLSAHLPAHPRALLLGLDLGPNLAVSGSLSAALWWQVARHHGARPSALRYTMLGAVLVPLTLVLALLALRLFVPAGF
jgi:arsenical pump membrane protein